MSNHTTSPAAARDLALVAEELAARNEALRYLTRWSAHRETHQARALRRSIRAIADGLVIAIAFRTGSARIEPHLEAQLHMLARALLALPALEVKLEGFADTRGARRFNRRLSRRRVYAVWAVLARAGLGIERMRLEAHGEERALYGQGDRDGHAFDRRVVITFGVREDER